MPKLPGLNEERGSKDIKGLATGFLENLEIERNCSPLTIRNYRHYLGRFIWWLEENKFKLDPSLLNLEIVKKYRLFLARYTAPNGAPLSRSTQSYHVIALRSYLRWLVKNDVKTLAPEKIDLPKGQTHSLKFLDGEQVERLLATPRVSTVVGLRDKAILEILFSTGLRVSELVRLNRDQVEKDKKEIGVIGKGNRPRVVFLSSDASLWANRYLARREDSWKPLFIHYKGSGSQENDGEKMRLTVRSVQRILGKYVKKAGLPIKATPHVIRHSYATDLLRAGADIRSVQEMLGHKNIATTQIYTHVTNKQLRQVHENFHGKGGR